MNHHDADLTDVIVVLEPERDVTMDKAVAQLKDLGLSVSETDEENDVVEGTIASDKVKSLQKLAFVKYVRNVFNYTADYPPGDPRNLDNEENPDAEDVDDAGA
jgi:hypothetical protein